MKRRYSWPEGHWGWPVELTHQHGVRVGPYIYSGGQADLNACGEIQNPGNLTAQAVSVMTYLEDIVLDLAAGYQDLVKLVVYFVGGSEARSEILKVVGNIIGPEVKPAISLISLPQLCYPGMLIELEGIAYVQDNPSVPPNQPRKNLHLKGLPLLPERFSHVVLAGDYLYTSDIYACDASGIPVESHDLLAQTHSMMKCLSSLLEIAGSSLYDVLKLNVYYTGDGTSDSWAPAAKIRAKYFEERLAVGQRNGPAATGMCVPSFAIEGQMTSISVTAVTNPGVEIKSAWPKGHWNWTTALPYQHGNRCGRLIHIGGQVSLNSMGVTIDPDNMIAQTKTAMTNLKRVLQEIGASLDEVVKITTFYRGKASAEELHQNLLIRSNSYNYPGPATTGIPMPSLVYSGMVIEIEAIAVVAD